MFDSFVCDMFVVLLLPARCARYVLLARCVLLVCLLSFFCVRVLYACCCVVAVVFLFCDLGWNVVLCAMFPVFCVCCCSLCYVFCVCALLLFVMLFTVIVFLLF